MIDDLTVNEADSTAILNVCLDQITTLNVSVDFSTVDNIALAGSDYQNTVGSVTIMAGETCAQVQITIIDDLVFEPTEDFTVQFNNPINGTLTDSVRIVTIIDNDPDCSTLQVATMTEDIYCFGDETGFIETTVSGGTGSYTYAWSNGATTANLYDLPADDYALIVTDINNGCTTTSIFTIATPEAISIEANPTNVSCLGETNGSIELAVSGGTSPYNFTWSNGATTKNINNLSSGVYTVTIYDNNFCQFIDSFTITEPLEALSLVGTKTDPTCDNSTDGSIDLTILGGTAPYSINWSNGDSTEDLAGIGAGTYTATITDNNGCLDEISLTLVDPNLSTYFEGQKNICPDTPADFTANDEGPGSVYNWHFWDGPTTGATYLGTTQGFETSFVFATSGDKLVRLIATIQNGCEIIYEEVVSVLDVNDPACSNCSNVTDGGYVGKSEVGCAPFSTKVIINNIEPTGGSGDLEFIWLESLDGTTPTSINDPLWNTIPGATQKSYDPGVIDITTHYIRLSKRAGCEDWMSGLSNIITKEVLGDSIWASFTHEEFVCPYIPTILNADTMPVTSTYVWYFFNGPTANDPYLGSREGLEVEFTFSSSGNKFVRLYVETSEGCTSTYESTITVLSPFDQMCAANIIPENITLSGSLNDDNETTLKWSAINEGLNVFYDVQHSTDGVNYKVINTLPGQDLEASSYSDIDDQPEIGVNYYRIKKFKDNGAFVYSNVLEIVNKPQGNSRTVSASPNPVENQATLILSTPFEVEAKIEITDAYGKTIQTLKVQPGIYKVPIDLSNYQAGFYFVYTNESGYRQLANKILKVTN